jgi:type II secretory pathway pseudopilin PulG
VKKGFTITELIVAVGLLAAVIAASGIVFHYSIDAQRIALATTEIMRTLRSITDQLDADFAGIRNGSEAPLIIEFHKGPGPSDPNADSIVFFAVGDFQDSDGAVRGNVARIYYGQAEKPDPNSNDPAIRRIKILARKQVILAPAEPNDSNEYEYESSSLIQQVIDYRPPNNVSVSDGWLQRPVIDPNNASGIPMYLAKGVDDFSIMFCDSNGIGPGNAINWQSRPDGTRRYCGVSLRPYPELIKFTFTLYDSKGILKGGRKFEHIVYIGR